jgi:hypothetical protein
MGHIAGLDPRFRQSRIGKLLLQTVDSLGKTDIPETFSELEKVFSVS